MAPLLGVDYELLPGERELLASVPLAAGEVAVPVLIENWTALLEPR